MPSSAEESQALLRSTDNVVAAFLAFLAAAFLAFLAEEQVSARTARLYLGHLGRFAAWLREQYRAGLLDTTSHDLREYRAHLAKRQKSASVNAALAALQRFYGWAQETSQIKADPTAKLKPIASQPLAPQGFTAIERQRLRREAERAGPMVDAIVTTLFEHGLARRRVGQSDIGGCGAAAPRGQGLHQQRQGRQGARGSFERRST